MGVGKCRQLSLSIANLCVLLPAISVFFSGFESGQIAGLSRSSNRTATLAPVSVYPYADVTTSLNTKPKGRQHVGDSYVSTPAVTHEKQDTGGPPCDAQGKEELLG